MPPPGWAPPPPPQPGKSKVGLIVGIVVGVVVLLCAGLVGVFVVIRNAAQNVADDLDDVLPSFTVPVDDTTDPGGDPDPGPTGETFNMEIGDGVEVTEPDGTQWTVYILDYEWFSEPCEDFGVADHPIVVFDVEFEVISGTASVNPLFDFSYITDAGASADSSLFSFCDDPTLDDTYDRTAGDLRTGQIAFEVPAGAGGRLEYSSDFEPTASWLVPGQN